MANKYETEDLLNQYLLFHYGSTKDQMPLAGGPKNAINFPIKCVTESLDVQNIPSKSTALELGCAVGRSSFELSRYCRKVIAIDKSSAFITAAQKLQQLGQLQYWIHGEGGKKELREARLPSATNSEHVFFQCLDVADFKTEEQFDIVLAANLLCRVSQPLDFLNQVHLWVKKSGFFILISPYSWQKENRVPQAWLEANTPMLDHLQQILKPHFSLEKSYDLPFLIREHLRKYEWGISQATVWKKK